jgi:hypothetical protein
MKKRLESRITALEKSQSAAPFPTTVPVSHYDDTEGEAVYQPKWIRDMYGIDDPASDEIDRQFGGIDSLPKIPITWPGSDSE